LHEHQFLGFDLQGIPLLDRSLEARFSFLFSSNYWFQSFPNNSFGSGFCLLDSHLFGLNWHLSFFQLLSSELESYFLGLDRGLGGLNLLLLLPQFILGSELKVALGGPLLSRFASFLEFFLQIFLHFWVFFGYLPDGFADNSLGILASDHRFVSRSSHSLAQFSDKSFS